MEQARYKYIYGPVASWRFGKSLGIDPISRPEKTCTFDCVYCQAGKTRVFPKAREIFIPTEDLLEEVQSLPPMDLDTITFAGNGEPTLAKNLGEMIEGIKSFRNEKITVITNASLINQKDVQEDLLLADLVVAKLDAFSEASLNDVNQAMPNVLMHHIIQGLKDFRRIYRGRLALQIMFIDANKKYAAQIADIVKEIRPDEIEINTPLRACAVKPLPERDILEITACFTKIGVESFRIRHVYEAPKKTSSPICPQSTERRRGKEGV
ncbi:MAG TPA: radical SAM protein [Candidatus Omnitrophota bacterium]|nr:radical SAM protein [Candidatus Omnitrophota bacterium]